MSFRHATAFALIFLSMFLLAACQKQPPVVTGTVASEDGVPIQYDSAGSGTPALVFIHGWVGDRSFWDNQSVYFSRHYQVIRIDLAGHGGSGLARKIYSIPAFGADVAAVVNKLGLKQVILIGHDLGGPAALEAEKRLGSRVIGVVAVNIFYSRFVPPDEKMAKALIEPFKTDFSKNMSWYISSMFMPTTDKTLVDRFTRHIVDTSQQEVSVSSLEELFYWYKNDEERALKRIGDKLRNINSTWKNANDSSYPGVVSIPGCGHFVELEKPAEFNRVLEGMIKQFVGDAGKK